MRSRGGWPSMMPFAMEAREVAPGPCPRAIGSIAKRSMSVAFRMGRSLARLACKIACSRSIL